MRQRTIRSSVHAIGIGVHSCIESPNDPSPCRGEHRASFSFEPIAHGARVHARAGGVSDTTLSTTLAENGVKVATVEHLLSALWGLGIDNLIVELNNEEVPIMDGSAAPFVDLIRSVGIEEQEASRDFIRIKREIEVRQGDAVAVLRPYPGFKVGYTFVADHPVYNRYPKQAELDFAERFLRERCQQSSIVRPHPGSRTGARHQSMSRFKPGERGGHRRCQ